MTIALRRPDLFRQQCFIDGQWLDAIDGAVLQVTDPASGQKLGEVPRMGSTETEFAIIAARHAMQEWRSMAAAQRALLLAAWSQLVAEYADDLAAIMTSEQGKPLLESFGEVLDAAACLEAIAEESQWLCDGPDSGSDAGQRVFFIREPIGVCAAITSWKSPIEEIIRIAAPALAAGCALVVLASTQTPYCALALAVLAEEAGIPAGIFSVVTGLTSIVGAELIGHPDVRKLSYFGPRSAGQGLAQLNGLQTKLCMEVDGGAPFIVFNDADIDAAVHGALLCRFRNSGQARLSASRIHVQSGVYDQFAEKLIAAVKCLEAGNGFRSKTTQGPLIDSHALAMVEAHIADALEHGAKLALGGKRHARGGNYFEPTILLDAHPDMLLAKGPSFGPLAALFRFEGDDDFRHDDDISDANLAGYFYTQDMLRVWRVAAMLKVVMVGINTISLSGDMIVTQHGVRRQLPGHCIEDYLVSKYLCMGAAGQDSRMAG